MSLGAREHLILNSIVRNLEERKMVKKYLVEITEHLRDGQEVWVIVANSVEEAVGIVNDSRERGLGDNKTFRVFEISIGKEIPLVLDTFEEPQLPKKTTKFRVK